jgi:pimeloyl-ACP methyl ester carboxylesterase
VLVITSASAAFLLGQALIGSGALAGQPPAAQPGPAGLAFYLPPSPLVPGAAGQVIWSRQVTGAAALPDAAENLLVLYHSRTLAGQDTAVSGTISIPPGQPPAAGWPVLNWTHGTTGVADICAPSRDAPGHPSHIYNQLADAMLNQWVKRGYVVLKTDYEGLGTPGSHPYLVGASEARSTVDILLAARQLLPAIGRSWAVMGHSQGGHAALFTASLAPAWAPDLDLIGAVAIAPVGGAHDLIAGLSDAPTPAPTPARPPAPTLSFLALVLVGAAAADHTVRVDQLLTPAALRLLAEAEVVGIDDLRAPGWPAPLVPAEIFRPGADLGPLLKVLAANDPAMLRPRTPVLIVQGHDDPIVARRSTEHIAGSLHASGAVLAYHRYPGRGHYDLIQAAHTENAKWVDTRRGQTPARRARKPKTQGRT